MAYYGKRIRSHKNRFKDQKREAFLRSSGLISLLFLVVLISLIYVSRIERFLIDEVKAEGNSVTSSAEIEEIANENLSGLYFKMFPKRNFLIYPKGKIEDDLRKEFRRIKTIDLTVSEFKKLNISVAERRPDSLWCGEIFEESLSGECFFVDSEGLIYSKAPNFTGNVFLRNYGKVDDPLNPIGGEFLPLSKYQSLKFLLNVLEQYNLVLIVVVKLPAGDIDIYFEDGGKLMYNSNQDIVRISEDLSSVLKDKEFKDDLENNELDYIDLRFDNKVYFKFK